MSGELTFAYVDDVGFAAAAGQPIAPHALPAPKGIGPLLELAMLARAAPSLQSHAAGIMRNHPFGQLLSANAPEVGLHLAQGHGLVVLGCSPLSVADRTRLTIAAKRAAIDAGFDKRTAGQLTAAMFEMLDNLVEHSNAPETGRIAYDAKGQSFTFAVADRGIGALSSLRSNPKFVGLGGDEDALPLVIQPGCSRHAEPGRGQGFEDLFRGLANHNGHLRFRSGTAAMLIDGRDAAAIQPKVKTKARLPGFFASVTCEA